MKTILVRWILSIVLLSFVWLHSHWSVALSITLMFFFAEAVTYVLDLMRATIRKERP